MNGDRTPTTSAALPSAPHRLYTLGELRLEGAHRALGSPRKALVLLAFVARRGGRGVRREVLAELLWSDRAESRARQSLRQVVLELRHELGDGFAVDGEFVRLAQDAVSLDAAEFEDDIAGGRFAAALGRWRGDFLAGAENAGGETLRSWLEEEREALRRGLAFACERLVEGAARAGDREAAAQYALQWSTLFPYDEQAHCALIAALDAAGRQETALARHAAFLVRLRHDLEVEPSREVIRLGERLAPPNWSTAGAAGALTTVAECWKRARAGDGAVALLRGPEAADRMALLDEVMEHCAEDGALLLTSPAQAGDESWAAARLLFEPLRRAPGLSGAPDEALAALAALVPGIRERFPSLPAAALRPAALVAAAAQVLRDVAAEVPVLLAVDIDPIDGASRDLLCALAGEELPGVLLVLASAGAPFERRALARTGIRRIELPPPAVSAPAAPPAPAARRRGRLTLTALLPLAVALAMGTVLRLRAAPPLSPLPPGSDRVAVLPFTVHGGAEHTHLRDGIAELLATSLDGTGQWRVVDTRSVLRQAPGNGFDAREIDALAARLGAELIVSGGVTAAGNALRVHAGLYRRSSTEPLARATAEGNAGELFALVDELARQLLGHAEGSESRLVRTAALTTDSLRALKAYLDGAALLRRFSVPDAAAALLRATTIDSTFALAWYTQAVAASWLLAPDAALRASTAAVRHAGRLAPRDRAIVEAYHAHLSGRPEEAELNARGVLAQYPDDVEARMHLAETLFHFGWKRGRSRAEAEPELRHVLRLEPRHWAAKLHLAQLLMRDGRAAEAEALLTTLISTSADPSTVAWLSVLRAAARGEDRELSAHLRDVHGTGDWWVTTTLWDLSLFAPDRLRSAERAALLLADSARAPAARAIGHTALAHLELARGRWRSARAELASLALIDREWYHAYGAMLALAPLVPTTAAQYEEWRERLLAWPADEVALPAGARDPRPWTTLHDGRHGLLRTYLLALIDVRTGRHADAGHRAAALESASTDTQLARALATGVNALLLRQQGRARDALALLESNVIHAPYEYAMGSAFWAQAMERYLRAELLIEVGRPLEALPVLRGFADNSPLEAQFRAPAALLAGRIMERQGDHPSAMAHYQRFVTLWQGCDAELQPLLVETQQRIDRLQRAQRPGAGS